jgi:hypothetical protein
MKKIILVVIISVLCIKLTLRDFNYSIGKEFRKEKYKLQQEMAFGGLLKDSKETSGG